MPIHDGPVIFDVLTGLTIALTAAMGGLLWVYLLARPPRTVRRRVSAPEPPTPGPIDLMVEPRPEPAEPARAAGPAQAPVASTSIPTPVESSPVA